MIAVPAATSLIIVDLDSTLAILPIDWVGMKRALADSFRDTAFTNLSEGLRDVSSRYGEEGRRECFNVIRKFEKESISGMTPVQEMLDVIETYRGKKFFAICSNNMHATIDDVVHALGFGDVFSALVGRDDVLESKPAPEGLHKILCQLHVPAEQAVFIGNQESDRQAGSNAGIETIIIGPFWNSFPTTDASG